MNTDKRSIPDKKLTFEVIGAAMEVHNELGHGFLEKVYERALLLELGERGVSAEPQVNIPVAYKGTPVGDYCADIMVNNELILELKSVKTLDDSHRSQTINYLKATGIRLALLINFGRNKLEYERKIY